MHGVTKKSRFLAIACGFITTLTIGNSVARAQEPVVQLYDSWTHNKTWTRSAHTFGLETDSVDLTFSGAGQSESYNIPNLKDYPRKPMEGLIPFKWGNWNDEAVGVWVLGGWTVELYTATRYGGKKVVLNGGDPGRFYDEGTLYKLSRFGMKDEVSSPKYYKTK